MTNRITRREAFVLARQVGTVRRARVAPREQLVNTLEYEDEAHRVLPPSMASLIVDRLQDGSRVDRQVYDRVTLRPRMLVPTLDLDLTVTLFGESVFAPIIVGPIAGQKRFHPDGEAATIQGAGLANAPVILSSHASVPLPSVITQAKTPVWYQVFAADPGAKQQMQAAADAGCRAICLTVGVRPFDSAQGRLPSNGSSPVLAAATRINWSSVGTLASGTRLPVIVKGVRTPSDAKAALEHNARGVLVSNYGGNPLLLELPAIVDAVGGRAPVLVDGGFRRGTDILKALALGADAVVVARPVMWGLTAYGVEGVRGVIEMLQTELARYLAMCGRSRAQTLGRDLVRIHAASARSNRSR